MGNNYDQSRFRIQNFNLLTALLSIVNLNDENDTDFVIAKYFIEHLYELKDTSIYKVADDCFVSRSSVQRFIKKVGYDSYTEMKASLDQIISHEEGFIDYTDHSKYHTYIIESISDMASDICKCASKPEFKRLCEKIMEAEKVLIVAAEDSSFGCKVFQQQMLSIGKLIRIITNASTNYQSLESLGKDDMLIVCSVTGNFALAINKEMQSLDVHKYLVTLNRTAVFENTYSNIYYLGNETRYNSRNIVTNKNVYNNHGLAIFLDLVFHECYMIQNKKNQISS